MVSVLFQVSEINCNVPYNLRRFFLADGCCAPGFLVTATPSSWITDPSIATRMRTDMICQQYPINSEQDTIFFVHT